MPSALLASNDNYCDDVIVQILLRYGRHPNIIELRDVSVCVMSCDLMLCDLQVSLFMCDVM